MLQTIDDGVIHYLNGYARSSEAIDKFFTVFLELPSVKMLPIVTCLVWLWFRTEAPRTQRVAVLQALMGGAVALFVVRLVQDLSPQRPRPLHAPGLGFVLPFGVQSDVLREWSSFPSDTATLAFALATGVWVASRPLGWACLAWAAAVVSAPRIYAGFHYPSDIVAGALFGVVLTLACAYPSRGIAGIVTHVEQRWPAFFYSSAFVALFQIATMFDDIRRSARKLFELVL